MIWCVEDDASIRDIEIYALRSAGFQTKEFENSKDFMDALKKEKPKLILLDIMLPECDGITLLTQIKNNKDTKDIPVIIASAKGSEYDKIKGLDLGADDYLVKPFSMIEMIARIKAVLRRCQSNENTNYYQHDGLCVNWDEHTVTINNQRIILTLKEFELLKLLVTHPGMAFTRNQIFEKVWDSDYIGDSRTLDMHIRLLRQKLGEYGKMIETVHKVGYRWESKYGR